jgi:hypothetical protein
MGVMDTDGRSKSNEERGADVSPVAPAQGTLLILPPPLLSLTLLLCLPLILNHLTHSSLISIPTCCYCVKRIH